MAGSPFAKRSGGNPAPQQESKSADLADIDPINAGDDAPMSDDPFDAADPAGISGYKPIAFMGQLVLLHPVEAGRRVTQNSGNEDDGKSPYAVFDVIPLTKPTGTGTPTKDKMVVDGDEYVVLNKDGDPESFEAYQVGERLDDLMFFNKPLVAEAEKALRKGNNWIIGRIVRGNPKPNQSPPIQLQTATAEDKALYKKWREEAARAAR